VMGRERHVELIDYLGVEYEYKQTIFSGTNWFFNIIIPAYILYFNFLAKN
jgi:hypothetical protein